MAPRGRRPMNALLRVGAMAATFAGPVGAVPLPPPRPAIPAPPPAAEAGVPLPAPRPEEAGPALPPPVLLRRTETFGPPLPPVSASPPAPPEPDPACGRLLAGGTVVARPSAAVAEGDACGIVAPVVLDAVVLRDGARVALVPPALMRCDLAERLADWLRDDVVPATAAEGPLLGVADAAAYTCRNRNWAAGTRISEHARGNAVDILAFRFAKRVIGLKAGDAHDTLAAIRGSACARFMTVLGPGSDAFHETDLHLDLEHRRHDVRLCQWTVP